MKYTCADLCVNNASGSHAYDDMDAHCIWCGVACDCEGS